MRPLEWFEKAAEAGHPAAMGALADMLCTGAAGGIDYEQAFLRAQTSAEKGDLFVRELSVHDPLMASIFIPVSFRAARGRRSVLAPPTGEQAGPSAKQACTQPSSRRRRSRCPRW